MTIEQEFVSKVQVRRDEYRQRVVGEKPCDGEAHSNAFIDHCMQCAPRWGIVPDLAPVDFYEAYLAGKVVPYTILTMDETRFAEQIIQAGYGRIVSRSVCVAGDPARVFRSYCVLRFNKAV